MKVLSPISNRLVDAVPVDFSADAEPWEQFTLEDGTVIKLRATPQGIMRLEGEFDASGSPIYLVTAPVAMRIVKSKLRGEPTPQSAPSAQKGRDPAVG